MEDWGSRVHLQEESLEEAWEYVAKNNVVGTRFIDPRDGQKIDWEEMYL